MELTDHEFELVEQLRRMDYKLHSIAHILGMPYSQFKRLYEKWRRSA